MAGSRALAAGPPVDMAVPPTRTRVGDRRGVAKPGGKRFGVVEVHLADVRDGPGRLRFASSLPGACASFSRTASRTAGLSVFLLCRASRYKSVTFAASASCSEAS